MVEAVGMEKIPAPGKTTEKKKSQGNLSKKEELASFKTLEEPNTREKEEKPKEKPVKRKKLKFDDELNE